MFHLIQERWADLEALCRKHHVKSLEVFGSAADGTYDRTRSDLDFLVQFLPEAGAHVFHGYFDLKDELERLFGHKVDLVMPSAVRNPYFLQAINRQRRVLYAA